MLCDALHPLTVRTTVGRGNGGTSPIAPSRQPHTGCEKSSCPCSRLSRQRDDATYLPSQVLGELRHTHHTRSIIARALVVPVRSIPHPQPPLPSEFCRIYSGLRGSSAPLQPMIRSGPFGVALETNTRKVQSRVCLRSLLGLAVDLQYPPMQASLETWCYLGECNVLQKVCVAHEAFGSNRNAALESNPKCPGFLFSVRGSAPPIPWGPSKSMLQVWWVTCQATCWQWSTVYAEYP